MSEQRSITSFFMPVKRKSVQDSEKSSSKQPKVEPSPNGVNATGHDTKQPSKPPAEQPAKQPTKPTKDGISETRRGSNTKTQAVDDDAVEHGTEIQPIETLPVKHIPSRPEKSGLKYYERGNNEIHEAATDTRYREIFRDHFLGPKPKKSVRRQMKPYDLQFIELKRQNEEAILMIQNGYKYQILGEDAYRVARFLGRSPISGWRGLDDHNDIEDGLYDRFASLTFPVERLPFYVEKLVMQGLKVAVAKQLETSALKAQSTNKRGPFRREVTATYTKGTLVEELTAASPVSGHVLALKQTATSMSLVAVQPATGDAVFDKFDDSNLAMELETRLMHIQPSEILLVGGELQGVAKRLVNSLDVRVVVVQDDHGEIENTAETIIPEIIAEDSDLEQCWKALRHYLGEFNLSRALSLDIKPFSLKSYMYLNGDTLNSLEIYENQTTKEPLGSLFWVLDNTKTPFGKRLLRNWIGKPLLDRSLLNERIEAMEEIMNADNEKSTVFSSLQSALRRLPDLERYTLQVYHNRIQPKQLYWYLFFFNVIVNSMTEPQLKAAKIQSPLIQQLLESLLPLRAIILPLLKRINNSKVRGNHEGVIDITEYFHSSENNYTEMEAEEVSSQLNSEFEILEDINLQIELCRSSFTKYLEEESRSLAINLKQANAQGEEDTFVIGVPKKDASKVPTSWRRQGAITSEVRFWSPVSIEKTKILKPLLEKQLIVAQQAYDYFVKMIADNYFDKLRHCVSSLATLDCLFSLANVSSRPNYVKPDLVDQPCLEIEDGRHPMLEQLMLSGFVPNSVEMYESNNRVMIITGANMGGKSSFVRQVALLVIMAQIGCYVPATSARISIMDAVFTRMGAFDNLMRGESTFMVELKECSAILSRATPRSLVILDEVGRGTSTMDGVAIADAVLRYMIEDVNAFTLFITHYPWLCEISKDFPQKLVQNWSMDCAENDEEVTFLYKTVPHAASRSYGINVARLAGLPGEILNAAYQKSEEFESIVEARRVRAALVRSIQAALVGKMQPEELIRHIPPPTIGNEIEETQ